MSYKLRVIDRYSQISPNFAVRNIKVLLVCEIYLDLRTEKSHNVTLNTILWIKKEFIPLEMVRQKEKLT